MKKEYAVIYTRNASEEDYELDDFTPDEKMCLDKLLSETNYELRECISDSGLSGISIDRPGIKRLKMLIERKKIKAVITPSHKCLSRNAANYFKLVEFFSENGIKLIYGDAKIQTI